MTRSPPERRDAKRWRRRALRSQSTTTLWQRCRGVPTSSSPCSHPEEKLAKHHDALSRAEQELSDRNAAVAALQSEIITLRSTLAVARDVGRAALTALRTEPATVSEAPWNAGWLAPVLRSLGFRGRGIRPPGQDPP